MIQVQLKLKLTKVQEAKLNEWLWHLTAVWNWAIRKIELDAKDKIYHSEYDLEAMLNGHSVRLGIPHMVLRGMVETAHLSWQQCFRNVCRQPKLKGNRNRLNSILFPRKPVFIGNRISVDGLPRLRFHKQIIPSGVAKRARIIKRAFGWYLCLFIDAYSDAIPRTSTYQVGIDPGFRDLLTLSNGEVVAHPREQERYARRLAQAQRGKNIKLAARLYERVGNRRKDRNHKLSRRLISENSLIAFSTDNHRGVAQKFGRSVSSSSHSQLRQMLAYKSPTSGTRYVEVPSRFSTKLRERPSEILEARKFITGRGRQRGGGSQGLFWNTERRAAVRLARSSRLGVGGEFRQGIVVRPFGEVLNSKGEKMPSALSIVQRFFPEVSSVVDARADQEIEVTKRDTSLATVKNHKQCAMAVACKRKFELDGVVISIHTAYLVKGRQATRYLLPESVSREVVSFDRNGGFSAGEYTLIKPGKHHRLGEHSPQSNKHNGTKKRSGIRHHFTEGIRTILRSAEIS
jgi:putative transposase